MFASKSLVRAVPLVRAATQSRQMTVVATYPLIRMSFTEKAIHGVIMTVAYCAVPAWVLTHLRSYRGLDK